MRVRWSTSSSAAHFCQWPDQLKKSTQLNRADNSEQMVDHGYLPLPTELSMDLSGH